VYVKLEKSCKEVQVFKNMSSIYIYKHIIKLCGIFKKYDNIYVSVQELVK